jgi:hypothetical protein
MHPDYTLTFTGHSLGMGVADMLTMVVVLNLDKLVIDRACTHCYTMASARCMSLNLVNSVVLQVTYPFHSLLLMPPCTVYSCFFFKPLYNHHHLPFKRGGNTF